MDRVLPFLSAGEQSECYFLAVWYINVAAAKVVCAKRVEGRWKLM